MDAQQIFYIVATIALVLLSLVLVGAIIILAQFRRFLRHTTGRIDQVSGHLIGYLGTAGKTWGTLTVTGLVIKLISKFIRRQT